LASAEAPRASRLARRLARLDPIIAPKRSQPAAVQDTRLVSIEPPAEETHERAIGQAAGPASNHPPKRYTSKPSGKMPGPSQSEPFAEAPRASRRAIRGARLDPNHPPK